MSLWHVGWQALPHYSCWDIPGLRHRDEWKQKGKRFRQRFHIGEDWIPREDDHPHKKPIGPCTVQAVRSVSDWSHAVLKEQSIQNACEYVGWDNCPQVHSIIDIQLISEAEHFIYIENQFLWASYASTRTELTWIVYPTLENMVRSRTWSQRP